MPGSEGLRTGTGLFMLLSICMECPAARLAAMSMLRWWLATMLALPGSPEGRAAGPPRCCWARLPQDMRAACPGPPWLARTAALLRGRMLPCHCAPAPPACGTAPAGCMLVRMRNLCTIELPCTCRAGGSKHCSSPLTIEPVDHLHTIIGRVFEVEHLTVKPRVKEVIHPVLTSRSCSCLVPSILLSPSLAAVLAP